MRISGLVVMGALALSMVGCGATGGADEPTGAGGFGAAPEVGGAPAETKAARGTGGSTADTGSTGSNAGGTGTNAGGTKTNAGGGTNSGGHGTGGASKPPTSAPDGPTIVYFRVAQKPRCPQGTSVYPVAAVPLVIEWKVKGAHQVGLSVDDPGPASYGTYDVQGSETFTFSCGGAPGTVEKHRYTIHTMGDGDQRSRSLTVGAEVYEIAVVE